MVVPIQRFLPQSIMSCSWSYVQSVPPKQMTDLHGIADDTPVRWWEKDIERGGRYAGDAADAFNDMVMT